MKRNTQTAQVSALAPSVQHIFVQHVWNARQLTKGTLAALLFSLASMPMPANTPNPPASQPRASHCSAEGERTESWTGVDTLHIT